LNQGTITARGTLNLASQDVNMHLRAALASSAAGQQQAAGGLLGTVLAIVKGNLVVPVLITGNMAHPNVAPDTAEMAKLKLSNLGGQTQNGKPNKPANPINSILDQLKMKQ